MKTTRTYKAGDRDMKTTKKWSLIILIAVAIGVLIEIIKLWKIKSE